MGRTLTEQVPTVRCDALSLRLDLIPAAVALHSGLPWILLYILQYSFAHSTQLQCCAYLRSAPSLEAETPLPSAPCWAEVQWRVF